MKIEYNGYKAKIEFDSVDNIYYGRVMDIEDTILLEGKTTDEIEKDLEKSIKEYKKICKEFGREPNTPK